MYRFSILLAVLLGAFPIIPKHSRAESFTAENRLDEKEEPFEYVFKDERKKAVRKVTTVDLGGGVKLELLRIRAGKFLALPEAAY